MAPGPRTAQALTLTTPLGSNVLLLTGFSGMEAISQLFNFQLDLAAPSDTAVPFEQLLGQPFTLALSSKGRQVRYFSGICASFSEGVRAGS